MTLTLIQKPERFPVTLQEIKDYCRIEHTDDNSMLLGFLQTAVAQAESITGRKLISQQWRLDLDYLPPEITLPYPNLISVDSIEYYDIENSQQTLPAAEYDVAGIEGIGIITEAYGYTFPSVYPRPDAAQITFTCGYASPDLVPDGIKEGIKTIIWHLYDNRGANIDHALLAFMFGPYIMRGFV